MRLLSLSLLAVSTLSAQTASVTGRITDPTGAVIPRASIVAKNVATGLERKAQANESGDYSIPLLPIGQYTVIGEAADQLMRYFPDARLKLEAMTDPGCAPGGSSWLLSDVSSRLSPRRPAAAGHGADHLGAPLPRVPPSSCKALREGPIHYSDLDRTTAIPRKRRANLDNPGTQR